MALAVVTGGSTGIGFELAKQLVTHDFDVIIAADEPDIEAAAHELRLLAPDRNVTAVQVDLATAAGVATLATSAEAGGAPIDALVLSAGVGVNGPFVDTPLGEHLRLIARNVTGLVHLAHLLVGPMARRGEGRVLMTVPAVSTRPLPDLPTHAASKAFVWSFAEALRTELSSTGVTVTALRPGPTDTELFGRADTGGDTRLGEMDADDPAAVAADGFAAMMAGRVQAAIAAPDDA